MLSKSTKYPVCCGLPATSQAAQDMLSFRGRPPEGGKAAGKRFDKDKQAIEGSFEGTEILL
jgi:hypothetical protein